MTVQKSNHWNFKTSGCLRNFPVWASRSPSGSTWAGTKSPLQLRIPHSQSHQVSHSRLRCPDPQYHHGATTKSQLEPVPLRSDPKEKHSGLLHPQSLSAGKPGAISSWVSGALAGPQGPGTFVQGGSSSGLLPGALPTTAQPQPHSELPALNASLNKVTLPTQEKHKIRGRRVSYKLLGKLCFSDPTVSGSPHIKRP